MRVLVTGAGGLLGSALVHEAQARSMAVLGLDRASLDITDAEGVGQAVARFKPEVVFNCAAFSGVDDAEGAFVEALSVNRDGARNVAMAAREHGSLVVHIGTDYVFDGGKSEPYLPSDQPAPLNLYGVSKLAGEAAVKEVAGDWLIVRTSWLFGRVKPGFVTLMAELLVREGEGAAVRVVDDQVSRPTWSGDLAPALLDLVARGARGCLHLANTGSCSRLELAEWIRTVVGGKRELEGVSSDDFGALARRPAYSVLDLQAAEEVLGRSLPPWTDSLERFLVSFERSDNG